MTTPPRTRRELFEKLKAVIEQGPYEMPAASPYNGTGGPGVFLEDLLGLSAGGLDIPDAVGWELKWYTDKTSLVTLFHKEADGPAEIMRRMVREYGWKDAHGRLSFRHTIRENRIVLRVDDKDGRIIVRPLKGSGPVPYWSHEEIIAAAGSKLRRLLLVKRRAERAVCPFHSCRCV